MGGVKQEIELVLKQVHEAAQGLFEAVNLGEVEVCWHLQDWVVSGKALVGQAA